MSFHNAHGTLLHSLRSLLWQTCQDWELILLDDGSRDNAAQRLKAIEDPRIRLYGDAVCRGLPVRLNQGVSLARGRYVARLDADDVAFPERLARQVAYLENNSEVDVLATAALLVDAEEQPLGILAAGRTHEQICGCPWRGFPFPHPTWMGRAEWFRRNPYDERARKAQDQSLLYRTYQTSRFAGLNDVLLGYRYAGLSARKTVLGRYHYLRALAAGGDGTHFWAALLGHTLAAVRDLASIPLGMTTPVIKARLQPVDAQTRAQWEVLRQRLSDPVCCELDHSPS